MSLESVTDGHLVCIVLQEGFPLSVGNTRYVRSMYQMICPVLEGIQTMEGLDASDGAGTGTEIDEVRGGVR